jgi:hypothetical protein
MLRKAALRPIASSRWKRAPILRIGPFFDFSVVASPLFTPQKNQKTPGSSAGIVVFES